MIGDFRADLHCHSTCSDGSKTPEELVRLAVEIGLQGLSITDHDSVAAYATALPLAAKLNLPMITGVEFSTQHKGTDVHLLAYAFPTAHEKISVICARHKQRRQDRCRQIMALLGKRGIDLSDDKPLAEALESGPAVGRPHVAAALIRRGIVKSTEAAFQQYLGEGRSCFVSTNQITTEETIATIHEAGGLAVLAHPQLVKDARVLHQIFAMPLDGIEAYYARFGFERAREWVELAVKKDWIITGGSDFHGAAKPQIPLGASWVPESTFRVLQNHALGHA